MVKYFKIKISIFKKQHKQIRIKRKYCNRMNNRLKKKITSKFNQINNQNNKKIKKKFKNNKLGESYYSNLTQMISNNLKIIDTQI